MPRLRIGLLSTARIGGAIVDGSRRSSVAEVVAVASRDAARAEAYAREHAIPRAHGAYEALLADPEVDAVYVALPPALHVPWSERALEAGKHVLVEKPLSRDPAAVERLFDLAERRGLVLLEGFMYRHQPQVKRLRELAAGGAIGELRLVRSQFSFTLDRPEDPRWRPELGGGALLDVGTYCVNVSRLVAGEPEAAWAEAVRAPGGVDVRLAATLRFPGDVLAHLDCAFDLPRRSEVEVVGSEGVLRLAPGFGDGVLELRRGEETERIDVPPTHRFQLQVENFAAAVRGEEPPLLDRAESVGQARALDLVLRAAGS
ncbi:MAG TPA: Gfo/Idh/MocA family oxidoreductase [Gaiellaceae bacterium]|nr:Gfo/Idh/MocA family oxidoreductase [Gaiellaceae bacterium]